MLASCKKREDYLENQKFDNERHNIKNTIITLPGFSNSMIFIEKLERTNNLISCTLIIKNDHRGKFM